MKKYELNYEILLSKEIFDHAIHWFAVAKFLKLIGEECEPERLSDYVVGLLKKKFSFKDMIKQLEAILDDLAEEFCIDLWKALIFEEWKLWDGL